MDTELAELRRKQAERVEKRSGAAASKAHELEGARLVDRFEETLGPQGMMFEPLDCFVDGWIIVTAGDEHARKLHQQALEKALMKDSNVDARVKHDFAVSAVVHPSREEVLKLLDKHAGLVERIRNAALSLGQARQVAETGKF